MALRITLQTYASSWDKHRENERGPYFLTNLLEQLFSFRIQLFPVALFDAEFCAVVVVRARVEVNLYNIALNAGKKIIKGKTRQHQQILVMEILCSSFYLAVRYYIETVPCLFAHQIT